MDLSHGEHEAIVKIVQEAHKLAVTLRERFDIPDFIVHAFVHSYLELKLRHLYKEFPKE